MVRAKDGDRVHREDGERRVFTGSLRCGLTEAGGDETLGADFRVLQAEARTERAEVRNSQRLPIDLEPDRVAVVRAEHRLVGSGASVELAVDGRNVTTDSDLDRDMLRRFPASL